MLKIWEDLLTDEDKIVIESGNIRPRKPLGKNPLLLIIDCQPNYIGADKPITEQLDEWPSGGGLEAWDSVRRIIKVRNEARKAGVPVFYTRNVQRQTLQFDSFSQKTNRDQTKYMEGNPATFLLPELGALDNELIISKAYPSAFYGTPLLSYLVKLGIDTIIIAGNSTSGCCRQTAADAVSMKFSLGYIEDCITDRTGPSHKIGMLDMHLNYGNVITSDEVIDYLGKLSKGDDSCE